MDKDCAICGKEDRETLERMFLLGQITLADAAKYADVDEPMFWHHINRHLDDEDTTTEFLTKEGRVRILDQCLQRLYQKVKEQFIMPNDPTTVKSLTALTHQLRGLARDMAVLEGDVKLGTEVRLQEINIQMSTFQSWLLENLCPVCKARFVQHLEELPEVSV